LNISYCGITVIGARSLAAGLLVNNSVRILDVSCNPITVEGARLILQSAVDNGVCQKVWIDTYDDHEVKKMKSILNGRKRQKVLLEFMVYDINTIDINVLCSQELQQQQQQQQQQQGQVLCITVVEVVTVAMMIGLIRTQAMYK